MNNIIASIYPCPFDDQIRHELNASIFCNGEIYAYEEAKVTSVKNDGTPIFPERALFLGFKQFNILPKEVSLWVLPTPIKIDYSKLHKFFSFIKAFNLNKQEFKKWVNKKVVFVKHHDLHTHLAIKSSKFEKGIYINIDGGGDLGDNRHTTWGHFQKNNLKEYGYLRGLNSLANFHSFVTEFCGFNVENGKTSGLASYGEVIPKLKSSLKKIIHLNNSGIYFNRERYNITNPDVSRMNPDSYDRTKILRSEISKTNIFNICKGYLPHDVARTAEEIISEFLITFLKKIKKKYFKNYEKIVFSGGLFLNVKINNDIEKSKIFKHCFFPMAPSDSGLSLGGIFSQNKKIKKKFFGKFGLTPLLGPSFNDASIKKLIDNFRLYYIKPKNLAKDIANEIINQKIVGVFNGRAEFGQRSLGSRSILADPRNINSKNKINQKIKRRDWFMPFAPAILDNKYNSFFKSKMPSMYMQLAEEINTSYKKNIPSAIHVNNTCRVQFVDKKIFPFFWKVINEFFQKVKIPMLLNTSFNRHGISTICSPRQAIEHLLEGSVDILYLEKYKIDLKKNRKINNVLNKKILSNEKMLLKNFCWNWLKKNKKKLSKIDKKKYINSNNLI